VTPEEPSTVVFDCGEETAVDKLVDARDAYAEDVRCPADGAPVRMTWPVSLESDAVDVGPVEPELLATNRLGQHALVD
jgi:hypothetical protein